MISRILSVFAIFAIASAASLASTGCTPGEVLEEKKYTSPKGFEFTIKTATCHPGPGGIVTRSVTMPTTFPNTDETWDVISKRCFAECTDPELCLCGSPCSSISCLNSPAGTVRPTDCNNLSEAILTTLHGTFFLNPGNFQSANSGSCEFVIVNGNPNSAVEYCWDDLALLGHSSSLSCPANQAQCHLTPSVVLGVAFA